MLGANWTLHCLIPALGLDGLPMLKASSFTSVACGSGELESPKSLEVSRKCVCLSHSSAASRLSVRVFPLLIAQ